MNFVARFAVVLLAWVLCACASATSRPAVAPETAQAPAPVPRTITLGPTSTRCDSAIAHALGHPADTAIRAPKPTDLFLPPMPIPSALVDSTLVFRLPVDEHGVVDTARVTVTGPRTSSAYVRAFRRTIQRAQFRPAEYRGCRVPATGVLTFTLVKG